MHIKNISVKTGKITLFSEMVSKPTKERRPIAERVILSIVSDFTAIDHIYAKIYRYHFGVISSLL